MEESYVWTPPGNLPSRDDYTLEISPENDTTEVNYSPQFAIRNPSGLSVTSIYLSNTSEGATVPLSTLVQTISGTASTALSGASATSTSASGATPISPPSTGTQTASSSPSSSPSTSSVGGVSATKLGIGLGVPLGVLLLAAICLAAFFIRRRRKAKAPTPTEFKSELDAESKLQGPPVEVDGESYDPNARKELDGKAVPVRSKELEGDEGVKRYELPEDRGLKS